MKLNRQEKKVYDYILTHRGATTRDITRDTFIQCPSGRITDLRNKGVDIQIIGQMKYPGAKAFQRYAIGKPLTKFISQVDIIGGVAVERRVEVAV